MNNNLKFIINNLGALEETTIELNKLTTIIGPNSSSKTYLVYLISGILKYLTNTNSQLSYAYDSRIGSNYLTQFTEELTLKLKEDVPFFSFNFTLYYQALNTIANQFICGYTSNGTCGAASELGISLLTSGNQLLNIKIALNDITPFYEMEFETLIFGEYLKVTKVKKSDDLMLVFKNGIKPEEIFHLGFTEIFMNTVFSSIFSQIFKNTLPAPFLITSERSSIVVFNKMLNNLSNTTQRISYKENKKFNQLEDKFFVTNTTDNSQPIPGLYQQAVLDNITYFEESVKNHHKKSQLFKSSPEVIQYLDSSINNNGSYVVKNADIFPELSYQLPNNKEIQINATSSSIKSLYLLDSYIKQRAKEGDLLIIDEPELNLHPSNQRKVARLLAMLVNAGINVMFTTHSDYIMNELNNLMLLHTLNSEDQTNLCSEYDVKKSASLNYQDVTSYVINQQDNNKYKLQKCEFKNGTFIYDSFDREIMDFAQFAREVRELADD